MKLNSPIVLTLTAALLLGGVLLGFQFGSESEGQVSSPQRPIYLDGLVRIDEEAFTTFRVFLTPVVADPQSRKPVRFISANINWRVRMDLLAQTSLYLAADPSGREPITCTTSFEALAADPLPEQMPAAGLYYVLIEPRQGLTWGMVSKEEDLVHEVHLLETRHGAPR